MRTMLQMLLLALATAGVYCATQNQTPANHSISARAVKTLMMADGTEPFPRRPCK
jgi:hypothetical protein